MMEATCNEQAKRVYANYHIIKAFRGEQTLQEINYRHSFR